MISVDEMISVDASGGACMRCFFVCSRADLLAKTNAYNGASAGVVGSGHKGA